MLAVAAIWLIAASRWVVTDTVVPWDAKNQFYAFFRFLAAALHAGEVPFWNPFHYGGHPSVADPQSLLFAPVFVVWAWFDAEPSMRAFDLIVYAHLLAGGLAMGALGWRAGWPLPASVLAAAVFMLGGPASGRLQHTGIILSYAMFPVALLLLTLALQRMLASVRPPLSASVAAVLALGRNHEALLFCFVLAAILAGDLISAEDPRRWLRERRTVLATIGVVAVVLLAVPLLLTMQFAALSNRPDTVLDRALEASLYPANLASMAVANIMGSLEPTQNYWGPNYETLPEVGGHRPLVQLPVRRRRGDDVAAVVRDRGRRPGETRAAPADCGDGWLPCSTCSGRYTPLYALAFSYVPGINLFRRPIDGAFVFVALLSVLAGHLLADYVREGVPRRRALAARRRGVRRPVRDRLGHLVLLTHAARLGFAFARR